MTAKHPYIKYLSYLIDEVVSIILRLNTSFESLACNPLSIHKNSLKSEHDLNTKAYQRITYLNKQNSTLNDKKLVRFELKTFYKLVATCQKHE